MKVIFKILFIGALFINNSACTNNPEASANEAESMVKEFKEIAVDVPPGFVAFKSPEKGFGLAYPENWSKGEASAMAEVLIKAPQDGISDLFQENINVIVQSLAGTNIESLENFWETTLTQLNAAIPDLVKIEETYYDWKGEKAIEVIFSGTQNGFNLMWNQIITIRNQQAYVFTYNSEGTNYTKYAGIVSMVFDSITF